MLSPEIWESESFGSLSCLAKLFWIGMISNADDEGVGRAQPKYLKSKILPYDEVRITDIEKALDEIGHNMSVTFYEVDRNKYYFLNNWKNWQSINKPTASKYPAPSNNGVGGDIPTTDILHEDYGSTTVALQEDYHIKEEKIKEEKRKEENIAPIGASTCDFSIDKKSVFNKYGEYKRILLTEEQYQKLVDEYDRAYIDKQINLLDEYIQINSNKNGYKDFNLVLRKSIRDNWFENKKESRNNAKNHDFNNQRDYSKEELDGIFGDTTDVDNFLEKLK